jgi:hypothetical protein
MVSFSCRYAGNEAVSAGDTEIRPVHLFMGLTKSIELGLDDANASAADVQAMNHEQRRLATVADNLGVPLKSLRALIRGRLRRGRDPRQPVKTLHRDREAKNAFIAANGRAAGQQCSPVALLWALLVGQNRLLHEILESSASADRVLSAARQADDLLPPMPAASLAFDVALAQITYPPRCCPSQTPWSIWSHRAMADGGVSEALIQLGANVLRNCIETPWHELIWDELDIPYHGDGMLFGLRRDPERRKRRWNHLLSTCGEQDAFGDLRHR